MNDRKARELMVVDGMMSALTEVLNAAYPELIASERAAMGPKVAARMLALSMIAAMQIGVDCRETVIDQMLESSKFAESVGYDLHVRMIRREVV